MFFNISFKEKKWSLIFIVLVAVNLFVWQAIVSAQPGTQTELYFLDVGQGDSELILLPGNIKIMIDGGPSAKVLSGLAAVLSPQDRYIDLLIISHPELDHFGGFIDVLKTYKVGAIIDNGRRGTAKAYEALEEAIQESGAPRITLKEGDNIKYQNKIFKILSPTPEGLKSNKLNDTTLVIMLEDGPMRVLYTGDIGVSEESRLIKRYNLAADVLKVGHHGSKYSSGYGFLRSVDPKIAVIEVGKNSYGHPTKETLQRLANIGSFILRTDNMGNIKISFDGEKLNVYH